MIVIDKLKNTKIFLAKWKLQVPCQLHNFEKFFVNAIQILRTYQPTRPQSSFQLQQTMFCKKQWKEIARGLLLHERLGFWEKHTVLAKVHSVNRKLLFFPGIRPSWL